MSRSKFLACFKTLTKEEHKEFKALVKYRQPKNDTAVHLLDYYSNQHPVFHEKKFTQENVLAASKIKGEIDKAQKLADVFGVLYTLIKDFLIYLELEKQPWEKEKLLASALSQRNDYSIFNKYVTQLIETIEKKINYKKQSIDAADFLALSELNGMYFFHPETDKFKADAKELDNAMMYLEKYNALNKLRYLIDYKLRLAVHAHQQEISFDYSLNFVKDFPEPVFQLYLDVLQLFEKHDKALFLQLIERLKENLPRLSEIDKSFLIQKLINHANFIYEQGKTDYLGHIFTLFKLANENGAVLYHNRISHIMFINAVSVASAVREFEWAKDFMDMYASFLKKELHDETLPLAQAYWHFFQQEYEETIQIIEKLITYPHLVNRLLAETLRLRVYYELTIPKEKYQYRNEFDTCAENLIRYLDREKEKNLSVERNQTIRNFTTVLKKIVLYFGDHGRTLAQKEKFKEDIKGEILGMKHIISRAWLLTKLKQWEDNQRTS